MVFFFLPNNMSPCQIYLLILLKYGIDTDYIATSFQYSLAVNGNQPLFPGLKNSNYGKFRIVRGQ